MQYFLDGNLQTSLFLQCAWLLSLAYSVTINFISKNIKKKQQIVFVQYKIGMMQYF
jgi:hypothetical protein